MLTVAELSEEIGKPINTIRYYIKHNDDFRAFWVKKTIRLHSSRGFDYNRDCYLCNEADKDRIKEFMETHRAIKPKPLSQWSDIAVHCWERKMVCEGCCFHIYCGKFTHPPMKSKVLEFVRLYGEPR